MDSNDSQGPNDTAKPGRSATQGALALKDETDEAITREQRRSRRKRDIRARTISVKRMTKRELEIGRLLYPETDYWRPRTRAARGGSRRARARSSRRNPRRAEP